ncbi:MAG: hypothetical protein QI197_05875 [Candidatus Korarchaeota archaeon]|nr:hypothetical protein [Candidatus Korarchaeota archaeon]
MSVSKRLFFSWGTMLGVIPFLVLLAYGAVVVSVSVSGAASNALPSWLLQELAAAIISAIVLIGIAAVLVRRYLKGGGVS